MLIGPLSSLKLAYFLYKIYFRIFVRQGYVCHNITIREELTNGKKETDNQK